MLLLLLPPLASLGPDRALLIVGLAEEEEEEEEEDNAGLPLVELAELKVLVDEEGVEILAGLQSKRNKMVVSDECGLISRYQ